MGNKTKTCRKHPKYKALRKPAASCSDCWQMWEASGRERRKAFMCGVAWQHELDATDVTVYDSAAACAKAQKCTKTCGIVEVEIALKRWVRKQRM